MKKRVIAIHLPQFYPFKENDEWWGKGFTEWRNVTKAKPRFIGHYQPHLPADLGFYDLRLKEARLAQIELARKYNIHGFCYYHYWFNGKLIMEKPVEEMLNNKEEDFPFMFCWANENWNRNWEGKNNVTLMVQNYSKEDDIAHFNYLVKYFKDPRYIRINNKPVIAIYRTNLFPNFEETAKLWRILAKKEGFDLYICHFEAGGEFGKEYMTPSIDAAVEFQPLNMSGFNRYRNPLSNMSKVLLNDVKFSSTYSYAKYVNFQCKLPEFKEYKRFPSAFPSWDNSSRRANRPFTAFKNCKPEYFKKWLANINLKFKPYSEEENLIFINAWNEWAEGCHLEPDLKYGTKYLEAVSDVFKSE